MEVSFIKGLDKSMIYIIGFDSTKWGDAQIQDFMELTRSSGLSVIGVRTVSGEGLPIFEPIGVDKEKLKELCNG